jgi:hypothetical protein
MRPSIEANSDGDGQENRSLRSGLLVEVRSRPGYRRRQAPGHRQVDRSSTVPLGPARRVLEAYGLTVSSIVPVLGAKAFDPL